MSRLHIPEMSDGAVLEIIDASIAIASLSDRTVRLTPVATLKRTTPSGVSGFPASKMMSSPLALT